MKENSILKSLRETYLRAAADLELFPEGSEEYRRAELAAMNTSRTVFELYGATAAEDLRAAGLQERSRVAERMRRGHAATNFEKITASPEALAAFLSSLPVLSGPWDEAFHRRYCDACPVEECGEYYHHLFCRYAAERPASATIAPPTTTKAARYRVGSVTLSRRTSSGRSIWSRRSEHDKLSAYHAERDHARRLYLRRGRRRARGERERVAFSYSGKSC